MKSKSKKSVEEQFKKMTETPIKKLIASLALPTVISMLVTTVYNVTDTFFVSKINLSASGATGIVFSLMAIIQAFGFMCGHGSGSCVSRLLGEKKIDEARKYCSTGIALSLIIGLTIMTLGIAFLTPFMRLLGSTETILPYAKSYAMYILISAPAMATGCVMNNILRYEGMASLAMIGLSAGGLLNIVLDPIFIFALDLGIAGAGISTAISQYISMLILLSMFLMKKPQSRISVKYISFKAAYLKNILFTGAPSLARQGLGSISNMLLNIMSAGYGDACIAAMSIVGKVAHLIFSVCIGIGQGLQPVSAFNYGAKKYSRVKEAALFTWGFATGIVFVLSTICSIFADKIVAVFRNDLAVIEIGSAALRFVCASLICLSTIMVANMTFQSIGKYKIALLLACMQNGLIFIPVVLILPRFTGVVGIELSQPLAYVLSALIALPILISFLKKLPKDQTE